jgi:hypothetical protein
MSQPKAAGGRDSDSSFRLHLSSFKKRGEGASAQAILRSAKRGLRIRNANKVALGKFSTRNFHSASKLQQT